ncbi:Ornithine carbamoyltransferase, anabolic [Candidatus Methanoperedenaceae archaeon GB50]|nr:MAG: Ornithine carbamoyltransferase, anabolic [Candidatus Methanoperedenaceae archaeon GB50]CAD7772547.1 Ornithine carbamoyltransferase, anabolic [Candidatus Methanoperedenaceae archaeon GB50]
MRNFLSIKDLTRDEIIDILDTSCRLKEERKSSKTGEKLRKKTLLLLFEKRSTRTRISFEVAMHELGGTSIYLNPADTQLGRGETIGDTSRVVSRYVHAIAARVNDHQTLIELAENSTIPVINALSDLEHPCQLLADLMTIREEKGRLEGLRLAWVGDGNNVCNSAILASSLTGIKIRVATPKGYEPDQEIVRDGRRLGGNITVTDDPREAVKGADIVYTDVWTSMGDEEEREQRLIDFKPYQVNRDLLEMAKDDAIVLHCLPAHRGEEITDEVMNGPNSKVLDQAENRLHTEKALLLRLLLEPETINTQIP